MVIGIIVSLVLLMFAAYRGYSVIVWAPILASLAAVTAGYPLLPTFTQIYMGKAMQFAENFFPIFILGAVFGSIMQESGAAQAIARFLVKILGTKRAILAVVLACAILTYGPISFFVVVFTVYPLAVEMFHSAGVPRRLIPATIGLGSFTFTMTALPGTAQIQNLIPTGYFGTNSFAAPWAGILAGLLMAVLGLSWLAWRSRRLQNEAGHLNEQETLSQEVTANTREGQASLHPCLAAIPLLLVLVLNFVLTQAISAWDFAKLQSYHPAFSQLNAPEHTAIWALCGALVLGIIAALLLSGQAFKNEANLIQTINSGAVGSLVPIMSAAAGVGYGSVIQSLPGFRTIANLMLNIDPGTPLVSEAIAVNVLAGITGSASGGISIAMETMGPRYLEWGLASGVSPELLHRVAALSSGGLDTLPHNGAVITVLAIASLSYKEGYPDLFIVTVIIPIISTFALILFTTVTGVY